MPEIISKFLLQSITVPLLSVIVALTARYGYFLNDGSVAQNLEYTATWNGFGLQANVGYPLGVYGTVK